MADFEDTVDGLAAVGMGVYLALVLYRGNLKPFLLEVVQEAGFVEFVVGLFILWQLSKINVLKPIMYPFIALGAIILAMRVINGVNVSKFRDFAEGRVGLFGLAGSIFAK